MLQIYMKYYVQTYAGIIRQTLVLPAKNTRCNKIILLEISLYAWKITSKSETELFSKNF